MSAEERAKQFESLAKSDPLYTQGKLTSYQLFGVSNSARVVDGGLFLGGPNLQKFSEKQTGALFNCVIKFPPEDEVYFAVYVDTHAASLRQRLDHMVQAHQSDSIFFAERNNNAKLYLAENGQLYLRNKDFWLSLKPGGEFDEAQAQPSVGIDKVAFAVYPPVASAQRSLLAREFVGYLAKFVGKSKVHEIKPWGDVGAIKPEMQRTPLTLNLVAIVAAIEALDGHYVDKLVERFHIALNYLAHKHFVILTGLSGTGKSSLVKKYAQAVHGITDKEAVDPLFFNCAVRPDWTDPSGLLGYHDIISGRYVVPPFLEAVLLATTYEEAPVFVCLDEMNLARVEYYFADLLSAMESQTPLQLHSNSIPLEGSTGGEIPASLPLPKNLFIVGTINVDESTHPLSDKVLDRAVSIDVSAVDLPGFFTKLKVTEPDLTSAVDTCSSILDEVNKTLTKQGLGFGYRVAGEFVRYFNLASSSGIGTAEEIIDQQLIQKVLVKLRGTYDQSEMLSDLMKQFSTFPRSKAAVEKLQQELAQMGAFQFSR